MSKPLARWVLVPLWLLILLAAMALRGPVTWGQATPAAPAASTPIQAPVSINGETLFSVGGNEPQARAKRIQTRIQTLITRKNEVGDFTVEKVSGSYLILIGDIPVLTVTATDAQDALMKPEALAKQWGGILTDTVSKARAERNSWVQRILNPLHRSFNQLLDSLLETFPRLISAILLLFIISFGAKLVRAGVSPIVRQINLDDNLRQLITSLSFYGSWIIGLITVASVLGFQASSLVTALGVSGFVLGFAFKDILSHFLAGILLLAGRSFQIGDQILIQSYEGTVERIDLRATHLRTYDNRLVIIPNADVFTSAVVNNTQSQTRRQEFDIGIDYEANIADAQLLAFKAVKATEGVLEDPAPDVLVVELASSWITLRCRFWTDSRRANVLAVGSEARRRVKEVFDREKIYLPFNITEVRLDPKWEKSVIRALNLWRSLQGDQSVLAVGDGATSAKREEMSGRDGQETGRPKEETEAEAKEKAETALPQNPSPEAS